MSYLKMEKEEVGMINFKLFVCIFLSVPLFIGCDKNVTEELPVSKTDSPFTSCADYSLSLDKGDKFDDMLTRGWEGEVDENAQILSTDYPLDKIYMLSCKSGADWKNGYNVLELPVYVLDGKRVLDICFRADGGKVWARHGTDSILVTDGTPNQTIFSSIPVLDTSMELCDVHTPGGVQTYEPYGDRLFRSQGYSFIASGDQIINLSDYKPVTEMSLILERLTNVIIPRFILSDDLGVNKTEYSMDLTKFTTLLGSPEDWEVRTFVAGNSSAPEPYSNGFPLGYNLFNGTNENGNRGVLSVSKEIQRLVSDFTHSSTSVGGKVTTYKGVGYHSNSTPFIFPANTSNKADLCFSFRYVGNDPEVKARVKDSNTFRLHATEDLTKGALRLVTVVIDIDDFVEAFLITGGNENSRVSRSYDSAFGEVFDVPYKLISE